MVEPRTTGGFRYAPYPAGAVLGLEAQAIVLREAEVDSSPEAAGAAAIVHLLARKPEAAQALLRKAIDGGARDPRLLSDLAAAHLVRADLADSPYDLIQALGAADRALEIDPSYREARFNQALALTRLSLASEAAKAWRAYLAIEADPGWSGEARAHLQRFDQAREADLWEADRNRLAAAALARRAGEVRRIVAAYRQPARLYVEDELLGRWAAAQVAGKSEESARALTIARAVADALGAGMLSEEVTAAEEAMREGGGRLAALVHGHESYARAREFHEQQKYPEAAPLFRQAAAALEEAGSPFIAWPELYLAIIAHHHADRPRAIRSLEGLRQRFASKDYAPLLGTIDWMIGQARGQQGPIASALPATQSARRQFERAGEVENQAAMDGTLARIYTELGDVERAWRHHYAALRVLPKLHKPRRTQNILSAAIRSLRETGDLRPAVHFQELLVEEAFWAGNPMGITIALRNQATLFYALGRSREAVAVLGRARSEAARIEDPALRQGVEVDTLVTEGRILRRDRPDAALQALNRAHALSLGKDNRHLLIQILQERAETWFTLGREEEAEADLEAGLFELERQRLMIEDGSLRIFFADQGRALLEERIALQLHRGEEAEAALDTAERLRARALLDSIGGAGSAGWPEPRPAREIVAALPPGTAILAYLWVRGDLLGWVITRQGVDLVKLGSGRERVEGTVSRFLRAVREGREAGAESAELRRLLISPLEAKIREVSTLVVIPDGALCRLPFAVLQERPPGGRFLLEEYRLASAPSASVYLALAERYRQRSAEAPASVLLVGESTFDRTLFPDLPSLRASIKEIEAIARLYSRSVSLTAGTATAERLLSFLPGFDVFHFAGHTVTPPDQDAPSLLLTASPVTGEAGLLPPQSIRCPRPSRTRLAVLAGCRTAEGRLSQNEGTLGLARAFLAAGVPAVVASFWNIDDEPASRLSLRFHEQLRAGADPLSALRQAQLDLLRSPDRAVASPRAWAAFQVIGGAFPLAGDQPTPSINTALH